MSDESPREIRIGESTYRITRFKAFKASLAGSLISRVMREVPEIQERVTEFRKRFRESNMFIITPAMAKMPRFAELGLGSEDFAAVGGNIELPEDPDTGTILVNVFPDLFDLAQKELERFLALIIIPNRDLEEADDADEVDEVLSKWGKKLMREADLDELLDLVVVGIDVFKEQMASKRDVLERLPLPWLQNLLTPQEESETLEESEQEPESNGLGETSQIPTETSPSQPTSSTPPSSSDSPPDSDGPEETRSMESLGTS